MKPITDINSFAARFAALRAKAAAVGIEVLPDGELERRRIERRKCRAGGNMGSTESRPTKCEPKREPKVPRMPYRDAEPIEDESGFGADLGSTESRPTTEPIGANVGVVVERALNQNEFVASGKADSANGRLLEFFRAAIRNGLVGKAWFSRVELKEVCRNDYINNRVDDVRLVLAPSGVKVVNANVALREGDAASSHYQLRLMSDGEMAEFERTGKPPTALD